MLKVEKVSSACVDMDNEDFEMLSLHGSWARERHIQTRQLAYGNSWYLPSAESPAIRSIPSLLF